MQNVQWPTFKRQTFPDLTAEHIKPLKSQRLENKRLAAERSEDKRLKSQPFRGISTELISRVARPVPEFSSNQLHQSSRQSLIYKRGGGRGAEEEQAEER